MCICYMFIKDQSINQSINQMIKKQLEYPVHSSLCTVIGLGNMKIYSNLVKSFNSSFRMLYLVVIATVCHGE